MLDENNSKFTVKDVFLQLLFMVLFLFILMWLFPTKEFVTNYVDGALDKKLEQKLDPIYERFFNENISAMQEAGKSYFTNARLPQKVGNKEKITLGEMLDNHLLVSFKDSNGKSCDTEKSYIEVTKESEEYVMKVNLSCTDQEDYILVHMGCYQYCTTAICEKQATVSSVGSNKTTVTPVTNNNLLCEYQKVTKASWGNYSDWSDWQTAKIDSTDYNKVETKTGKVYVGTNTVAEKKTETAKTVKQNKTTYTCDSSYDNAGTYTKKETCVKKVSAKAETKDKTEYTNAVSSSSTSTVSCDRKSNAHYATGYKTNWSSYSWYDSNKAANSGWRCSSTRKVKSCSSCTTYKTQWYCSYSYSSSYQYIDYYYYTCPSGCYKSGDYCYRNVTNNNLSCPSGYTASGSGDNLKCSKTVKQTVYVCSSEYDNAGTYTKETTCTKSKEPVSSNVATYVCGSGYDNEGIYTKETTCTKTSTVYKKQEQYKNVTYYRQKTRKLIAGNKYVKWSNCSDSSLINAGYSKTGKTKNAK